MSSPADMPSDEFTRCVRDNPIVLALAQRGGSLEQMVISLCKANRRLVDQLVEARSKQPVVVQLADGRMLFFDPEGENSARPRAQIVNLRA